MIREARIIAVCIAGIMLIATIVLHKKKKLSIQSSILWSFIWAGMIMATLLFDQLAYIAEQMKIETFDLFIITAIIILFIMSFSQFNQMKQNQKQIEEIVSEVALRDGKKADNKEKKND